MHYSKIGKVSSPYQEELRTECNQAPQEGSDGR